MPPKVLSLDHLVLTVADVETAAQWYERVLGMRRLEWNDSNGAARVSLHWHEGGGRWRKINLHQVDREVVPHAKTPSLGSADLCFIVDYHQARMREHLDACGVVIELGPVDRTGAMGNLSSLYVRDPDGNLIELAEDRLMQYAHIAEWENSPRT